MIEMMRIQLLLIEEGIEWLYKGNIYIVYSTERGIYIEDKTFIFLINLQSVLILGICFPSCYLMEKKSNTLNINEDVEIDK